MSTISPPIRQKIVRKEKKKSIWRKININKVQVMPNISQLQQLYDITPTEMNTLRNFFTESSGIDCKLNYHEFIHLFGLVNPNLRGPSFINIAEIAFHKADSNEDGLINFNQFLAAYCMTKESRSFITNHAVEPLRPDSVKNLNLDSDFNYDFDALLSESRDQMDDLKEEENFDEESQNLNNEFPVHNQINDNSLKDPFDILSQIPIPDLNYYDTKSKRTRQRRPRHNNHHQRRRRHSSRYSY
jgi:tryptophan 2,3-dioxygenase